MKQILVRWISLLWIAWIPLSHAANLTININGIQGDVLDNVKNRLDIVQKSFDKTLSADDIQALYQEAPSNILKAMQPYGYYKPQITGQLRQRNGSWTALFHIDPGPPLLVHTLEINIKSADKMHKQFQHLQENLPLKLGDILHIQHYEQIKRDLFEIAHHNGYINARLTRREIQIDLQRYTAAIYLDFETGKQYFFGPIHFNKVALNQDFLKRFLPFKEGDVYSTANVLALQEDLNSSDYFQDITITPEIEKPIGQHVPINIELKEKKSKQLTFGLGYGTDTGPRTTITAYTRRANAKGHRIRATFQISQVQRTLQAQYIMPGKKPTQDKYQITGSIYDITLINADSEAAQLSFAAIRSRKKWQQNLSINALYEQFIISGSPREYSTMVYPAASWKARKADDWLKPTSGYLLQFNVQGASTYVLSDVDFLQGEVITKYIYPLAKKTRAIARGTFGYTFTDKVDKIPPTLHFYAGGAQSIRGYPYHYLGPGKILVTGSAELQQQLTEDWHALVFYDVGDVFNHTPFLLKKSIGIGVGRDTPLGPIQFSVARPMDKPGKRFELIFNMGPEL